MMRLMAQMEMARAVQMEVLRKEKRMKMMRRTRRMKKTMKKMTRRK